MRRHRIRIEAPLPSAGAEVVLDAEASHHLLSVCRHPRGATLIAYDGRGAEADVLLVGIERSGDGRTLARLQGISPLRTSEPPQARHLVLGIPKGPALEHALRMAVEVGATHIHPVISERTVPNRDHGPRWSKIVAAAATQCGCSFLPSLSPLGPLAGAIERIGAEEVARHVAVVGAPQLGVEEGPAALAIGPEGGWSPREIDAFLRAGWSAAGLGPWVLRVDTAVAVGLAALG